MAGAAITAENAPREVKGLMNLGRYSLRNLAYELGLVSKDAPESVTQFDKESLEKRAGKILEGLTLVDKKGNKETTKKREPAKTREPAKPKEETAEKPKTRGRANSAASTIDLSEVLEAIQGIKNHLDEIETKVDENHDDLVDLRKATMSNMGLNAIMAEQAMQGATIEDLVKDGIEIGAGIEIPDDDPETDDSGND